MRKISYLMIFISYRRDDSSIYVGRIYDRLVQTYGAKRVFLDVHSIPAAQDFRQITKKQITQSEVVLAIIGRNWLVQGPSRRIDAADDPVRIEIEQAIEAGKPIIPIYCNTEVFLSTDANLPKSLEPLIYANSRSITSELHFEGQMELLKKDISRILFPSFVRNACFVLARFISKNKFWLVTVLIGFALLLQNQRAAFIRSATRSDLHSIAHRLDVAFSTKHEEHHPEIARVIVDREELFAETDLSETLRSTRASFDAFADKGGSLLNQMESIKVAMMKGAKFRLLVADASMVSIKELSSSCPSQDQNSQGGSFVVKLSKTKVKNLIWVRDTAMAESSLAHIQVSCYRGPLEDTSLRFGFLAPREVRAIQHEFDYLWNQEENETLFSWPEVK